MPSPQRERSKEGGALALACQAHALHSDEKGAINIALWTKESHALRGTSDSRIKGYIFWIERSLKRRRYTSTHSLLGRKGGAAAELMSELSLQRTRQQRADRWMDGW